MPFQNVRCQTFHGRPPPRQHVPPLQGNGRLGKAAATQRVNAKPGPLDKLSPKKGAPHGKAVQAVDPGPAAPVKGDRSIIARPVQPGHLPLQLRRKHIKSALQF